ncbi:uncharacterized protein LOC119091556 [Pollicipes pollicipes]|uniref:uncharacterized protein LOC119091556 n=1 Tax=Pollicipes pollicipes TaxID=41117 RepID=UPI0018852E2B|nr:uncharacterized protein LOC119091556 [Pollicipes pollicipes]
MGRKQLFDGPTKRDICMGCALVTGLLFLVFGVLVVIYMQAHVDAYINKMLAFSEDSPTFHAWKDPPVQIKQSVYFFNLTNKEEFLNGTAKPRVQQVGPYVIGQKWERRNITFHPNGTLSARLFTKLFFIREDSSGPETDLITTLNVPMISAAEKARFQPLTARLTTSSLLEVLEETPIITRSVHQLVYGYRDPLLKLAKDIQPPGQSLPYESFGYFVGMLAFSEDSPTFHAWKDPPVQIKQSVYFFNLTNKEEFLNGTAKPRVQQVGPYVIGQKWERRNITFHPNGTLSARLFTKLFFIREDSSGPETDLITTLNVPMISAAEKARFQPLTARLTTSSLLEVLEETPIITRSVHQLVYGYRDPLLKLAKDIQPPGQSLPYESFGYFVGKNNSVEKTMLINTGQSDWRRIGMIERYDGSRTLPFWNTRQCNMVNGSDGTVYPPGGDENTTVYLFARDICRSMPLLFEKHVMHSGVRTLRYTPPEDVFDSVDTKPENMCYCVGGPPCAPKGLFNISVCQYGSPTFISFPHFYLADPSIPAKVDGLAPSKEKHQFFVDIVPRVGVSMKAKIRVQINFKIGPVPDVLYTQNLPDMFFPVLWMEAVQPVNYYALPGKRLGLELFVASSGHLYVRRNCSSKGVCHLHSAQVLGLIPAAAPEYRDNFVFGFGGGSGKVAVGFASAQVIAAMRERTSGAMQFDTTLTAAPKAVGFDHLLVLFAEVDNWTRPVLFVLLSGRSCRLYGSVLRLVKRTVARRLTPAALLTDGDLPLCAAVAAAWPDARRAVGYPHYCRAVYGQLRRQGLSAAFREVSAVREWLGGLLAAPLLPADRLEHAIQLHLTHAPPHVIASVDQDMGRGVSTRRRQRGPNLQPLLRRWSADLAAGRTTMRTYLQATLRTNGHSGYMRR